MHKSHPTQLEPRLRHIATSSLFEVPLVPCIGYQVLRRKPVSNLKFYASTRLEQLWTKDERTSFWDGRAVLALAGQDVKIVSSFVLLSYGTYQVHVHVCCCVVDVNFAKFIFWRLCSSCLVHAHSELAAICQNGGKRANVIIIEEECRIPR